MVHTFDIDLADNDRHVYESLSLRVARHPSESDEFLLTRVLAYALEYDERLEFSRGGLSDVEEPPLSIRDLTGTWQTWIEIGLPDEGRLHKAAKVSPRVVVYAHRDPSQWWSKLDVGRIFRGDAIEFWAMDRALLGGLTPHLDRRLSFALSVTDRELYLSIGNDTLTGRLTALRQ